jgi:hypothetical protein
MDEDTGMVETVQPEKKPVVTRKRNVKAKVKGTRTRKPVAKAAPEQPLESPLENTVEIPTKKAATRPWEPAKLYNIPEDLKDPRFVYRMVNSKKEGNELKKLQEGWEYDKDLVRKMTDRGLMPPRAIGDGTPVDGIYRIREMIVMRIPKEMAESRNKFYLERGNRGLRDAQQTMRNELSGDSPELYGNFKEERIKDNIG